MAKQRCSNKQDHNLRSFTQLFITFERYLLAVWWCWGPLMTSHLGSRLKQVPPKEGATIAQVTLAMSTSAWKKQHTWLILMFHWWEQAIWLCLTSRVLREIQCYLVPGRRRKTGKTGEQPQWLPQLGVVPTCFHGTTASSSIGHWGSQACHRVLALEQFVL